MLLQIFTSVSFELKIYLLTTRKRGYKNSYSRVPLISPKINKILTDQMYPHIHIYLRNLKEETFADRNFRDFTVFDFFLEKLYPRNL